jgi:hypothetical protein
MAKAVLSLLVMYAALASSQISVRPESGRSGANPAWSSRPAKGNPAGLRIATGTEIRATLDTPLSTRTAQPGDVFVATVTEPIRSTDGDIVIPAGSRLRGEVSESDRGKTLRGVRSKDKLSLHFSNIQMPDGGPIPLSARLISLDHADDKASRSSQLEIESGKPRTTIANDSRVSAGQRTVTHSTFGRALKGLAVGTTEGGGYVLAINGKEITVPAQTRLTLRLDHDLSLASPQ